MLEEEQEAELEKDGFCEGVMNTIVYAEFSLWERILFFISGRMAFRVLTKTDVVITKSFSVSTACILPPSHPTRPGPESEFEL